MKELDKPTLMFVVSALMAVTLIAAQLGAAPRENALPAVTAVAPVPPRLADRIPDPQTSQQIQQIVVFAEGRSALTRHDLSAAARRANELPFSLKRALLLMAVASQLSVEGDNRGAAANLHRALTETGPVPPGQRIRLLAMAARIYLTFDPLAGQQALHQAVRAWRSASPDVRAAASGNVGATSGRFMRSYAHRTGKHRCSRSSCQGSPEPG